MMSSMFKALLSLLTVDIILTCKYISRSFEILEVPSNETTTNFQGEKLRPTASRESYLPREPPSLSQKLTLRLTHTHTHMTYPTQKLCAQHAKPTCTHSLFFSSASTIQFFPKSKRCSPIHLTNWPHPNSFDLGRERGMQAHAPHVGGSQLPTSLA